MTYDFAPLFRTAIGFDRLARLVDNAAQNPAVPSYPPYNIEKLGEDSYVLTMAVAGFGPEDIDLVVQDNTLVVAGRGTGAAPVGEVLHRGIATRAFERRFVLADHILVEKADLTNGLLRIAIRHFVPEALKPRRIPIGTGAPAARGVAAPADTQATVQATPPVAAGPVVANTDGAVAAAPDHAA